MVTSVTNLGRSGLADFLLQRLTAVILGLYTLCVGGFFATTPVMDHARLAGFFSAPLMRAFTTLAVASLVAHAWIGMWTIGTDYVRRHYFGRAHTVFLAVYQLFCLAVIFAYVVWPLTVIWGLP